MMTTPVPGAGAAGPPLDDLAAVALENLSREFPYAAHHVQSSPEDLRLPRELHPAFATSFDWHSSVHMHWLLATLVEEVAAAGAEPAWLGRARALLTDHLSPENLAVEAVYLREHPTWERPYGWAWAAQLAQLLAQAGTPELRALAAGAAPILDAVLDLTLAWLPRAPLPVRHGLHTSTAFGLRRLLLVARASDRTDTSAAIEQAARRFFLADADWAFEQERSGQDFLSPGLTEADLMIEVLDDEELSRWLPRFLTHLGSASSVLAPVPVIDPSDGFQSHLDGLGLTAAASGLRIAGVLDRLGEGGLAGTLRDAAPGLMAPGLTAAVSEEYMASHWLATFAWEAHVARRATAA